MASELMIGTWTSRSVAMVAAGLRLTGTKAKKLAITTSNKQQLVLTDGTVLKQTKAMVMKLVEIAGSPFTKTLLGADALERAKVSQWMEYTTSNCRNKDAAEDSVQNLDAHFKASTFVALERMTLADLMLYHALYPYIAEAPPMKMKSHIPSVCRWFDLVQHNDFFSVRGKSRFIPPLIDIFLKTDSAPPSVFFSGGAVTNKTRAPPAPSAPSAPSAKVAAPKGETKSDNDKKVDNDGMKMKKNKKDKKDKKDKKKGEGGGKGGGKGGGAPAGNEAPISPDTNEFFYAMDLRVGKITKAWPHPDSDSLWCEEIDVGEGTVRQIASGLRKYYSQEEMENRMVLVVCNLKARNIAGFPSNGMVACAVSGEGDDKKAELVEPPKGAKPGDRLMAHGILGEGVEALTAAKPNKVQKKKVWDKFAPDLKTNSKKQVVWREFTCGLAPGTTFTVPTIANGQVS
jgi:aminoacyl tRNA synthase complex-interacting multifunctional protein 1